MPTTHTTPIDLRSYHGREFEGVLNDHDSNDVICKGKICIDKFGDVYLCQNKVKGIRTEDTLGFDYSWIAQESNESSWSTPSVKSITILDPPSSIDPRWDWKDGEEVAYDDEERKRCRVITDNIVAFICDEGTKAEAITAQMTFREAYEHGYRKLPSPPSRKLTEITEEMFDKTNLIGRKVMFNDTERTVFGMITRSNGRYLCIHDTEYNQLIHKCKLIEE